MHKILIVENEDHLRDLYQEELKEEGYDVEGVSGGEDALQKIKEGSIDLMILDIKMPGMTGLDVLRKMLGDQNWIPTIILSAYPHYKDDFMSWAAEEYVVKSQDLDELKEAVRKVLDKHYSRK